MFVKNVKGMYTNQRFEKLEILIYTNKNGLAPNSITNITVENGYFYVNDNYLLVQKHGNSDDEYTFDVWPLKDIKSYKYKIYHSNKPKE